MIDRERKIWHRYSRMRHIPREAARLQQAFTVGCWTLLTNYFRSGRGLKGNYFSRKLLIRAIMIVYRGRWNAGRGIWLSTSESTRCHGPGAWADKNMMRDHNFTSHDASRRRSRESLLANSRNDNESHDHHHQFWWCVNCFKILPMNKYTILNFNWMYLLPELPFGGC